MRKVKKRTIAILIAAVVLIALFFPFLNPLFNGSMGDGGSQVYRALTYTVIKFHSLSPYGDRFYEKTRVYWFPENFRSIDELWWEEISSLK